MTRGSNTNESPNTSSGKWMAMWSLLWKSRVPPKVKLLSRKLCHNIAPITANLSRRIKESEKVAYFVE